MARSIKGSSQRPDTLMQDRTSANSMKVLLQRAAGPYIRGQKRKSSERANVFRFTPESGQTADASGCPLCAMTGLMRCSSKTASSDQVVHADRPAIRGTEGYGIFGGPPITRALRQRT